MIGRWTANWAEANAISHTYKSMLTSTNDYAKDNYLSFQWPHIVITDEQTAGRGRGTHSWLSAEIGKALYTSLCFRSKQTFPPMNTIRIGLALMQSLETSFTDKTFSLKAPNDIYCENKKVAGILVEGSQRDIHHLFVGIGINVMAKPDLAVAGYISSAIQEEKWIEFLSIFWQVIKEINMSDKTLSYNEQQQVLAALQRHDPAIENISSEADILYADRTIAWSEL